MSILVFSNVGHVILSRFLHAHGSVTGAPRPALRQHMPAAEESTDAGSGGGPTIAAVQVEVEDMEAQDFEALLRYMYTDSLPEIGE